MAPSLQLAPLYPIVHQVLKPLFPSCLWTGCDRSPTIALTFDDGPHPQYTPELLKVLERHQVQASFFWLGVCVERSPAVAKAAFEQGHWLGLHGFDHRSFPTLSELEFQQTLEQTQTAIAKACGIAPDRLVDVRPPNGLFTPKTLDLLAEWNYRSVMWSVVPEDWVSPGIVTVVSRVLRHVRNGSIIVLHDGHFGGADVAQIADLLIPMLQQQGYTFVSIDQLWHQSP